MYLPERKKLLELLEKKSPGLVTFVVTCVISDFVIFNVVDKYGDMEFVFVEKEELKNL